MYYHWNRYLRFCYSRYLYSFIWGTMETCIWKKRSQKLYIYLIHVSLSFNIWKHCGIAVSVLIHLIDWIYSPQVSIFPGDSAPVVEDHLSQISIPIPNLSRPETSNASRCQFHKHFTSRFYSCRSQKAQKDIDNLTEFLCFCDLWVQKLFVKCLWYWPQVWDGRWGSHLREGGVWASTGEETFARLDNWSISPTFYTRIFRKKVLWAA